MATETRTVTDEDRILAAVLVAEVLEEFPELEQTDLEALRAELMDELLWTTWGRERLRQAFARQRSRAGRWRGFAKR